MEVDILGFKVLVSPLDLNLVNSHKWRYWHKASNVYFYFTKDNSSIYMHRQILITAGVDLTKQVVDHINGDTLDNRRENLRACTNAENLRNQGARKKNVTGYKGVSPQHRYPDRYRAEITANGEHLYLGLFDTPELAAIAYNEAAIRLHGQFARLNILP